MSQGIDQSTPQGLFYLFEYLQADVYNTLFGLTPERFPYDDDGNNVTSTLIPDGRNDWIPIDFDNNELTDPYFEGLSGFAAAAYYNAVSEEVIISYRGTEPFTSFIPEDLVTDVQLAFGQLANQIDEAKYFYELVQAYLNGDSSYSYNDGSNRVIDFSRDMNSPSGYSSISFTGHSLGGGLAQLMGTVTGNKAFTFNALGMRYLIEAYLRDETSLTEQQIQGLISTNANLITNYIVNGDFVSNTYEHIGTNHYSTLGQFSEIINDPSVIVEGANTLFSPITALFYSVGLHNKTISYPYAPFAAFDENVLNAEGQFLRTFLGSIASSSISVLNTISEMSEGMLKLINHLNRYGFTFDNVEIIDAKNPDIEIDPATGTPIVYETLKISNPIEVDPLTGNLKITTGISFTDEQYEIAGDAELLAGSNNNSQITKVTGKSLQYGNGGNDTLAGGNNVDLLFGGADDDQLLGNAGNDTLVAGSGLNTLLGGLGDDLYVLESTTDVVTENENEGIDTVKSVKTYTLGANIENLTLTATDDTTATGNSLANQIMGNEGNNTLIGGLGNDTDLSPV